MAGSAESCLASGCILIDHAAVLSYATPGDTSGTTLHVASLALDVGREAAVILQADVDASLPVAVALRVTIADTVIVELPLATLRTPQRVWLPGHGRLAVR